MWCGCLWLGAGPCVLPEARVAAQARTYNGWSGHLASITSSAENAFIWNNLVDPSGGNIYIGGYQPPGNPEPAVGWQWVTGEPLDFTAWLIGPQVTLQVGLCPASVAVPVSSTTGVEMTERKRSKSTTGGEASWTELMAVDQPLVCSNASRARTL